MGAGQREQVVGIKLRRRRPEGRDVEAVDQILHRMGQLHRLRRAKPRHQRQQRHRLHPLRAQIAQRQRAKTLGQRLALRAGQQRMVRKGGRRAAHRLHDLDLGGGIGHMIRAAHDAGHAHVDVIDRRGKGIQHLPVGPDQHRVRHAGGIDGDRAKDAVGPFDPRLVQQKAPVAAAVFAQAGLVSLGQRQRRAVIDRGLVHVQLLLALQVQLDGGFEAFIEPPVGAQLIGGLGIAVHPQRLLFDPVPGQAQPLQVFHDPVGIFLL